MGTFLGPEDLAPFAEIESAKATQMIEDAESLAALAASCITEDGFLADAFRTGAVKAILRGAVLRWEEAGSGATQTQVTGPFSETTQHQARRGMFWPSEIEQLRNLCLAYRGGAEGAFTVDTAPGRGATHLPWCSAMLGALYCSCGVDIAGRPIFEGGTS